MTLFLNTGQFMRQAAGHTDGEFRWFVSEARWPYVDTTAWNADPSGAFYDPDTLAASWVEYTRHILDGIPNFHEYSDSEITRWQLTVNGDAFDSRYIQADHPLLVLYRFWPDVENAGWSDWHLLCLGYFKEDTITQDHTDAKRWTATVEGVSQYFAKRLIPPLTFKRTDIALNQPVTTSDLLTDMKLEANTGEFLGLPANSGQNLTDGDDAVPCIFANEPTPVPEPIVPQKQDGSLRLNEVYLQPPIGYPNGYQWIEIFNTDPHNPVDIENVFLLFYDRDEARTGVLHLKDVYPLAQGEDWVPSGSALAEHMYGGVSSVAVTNPANLGIGLQVRIEGEEMSVSSDKVSPATFSRPNNPFPGIIEHPSGATIEKRGDTTQSGAPSIPPRGFLILCENRRRLQEAFRIPQGALIAEWTDDAANRTLRMDTVGGHLRLMVNLVDDASAGYPETDGSDEIDRVYWGADVIDEWNDEGSGDFRVFYTPPGQPTRTVWNGARVPVPALARSFKRTRVGGGAGNAQFATGDSDSAADWVTEDVPTPGRRQAAIGDDGLRIAADIAWFSVQLPNLTCELARDLNDGDTTVYLNNTNGLYKNRINANRVLIVATVATYTLNTKTATTLTLTEAWAGGNVPAGTRIYPVDRLGVAHDAWPVTTVELVRKQQPTPSIYTIYTSALASPLYPADGDEWKEEWTEVAHANVQHLARLTQDIADDDTIVHVDTTANWPDQSILAVRTPDQHGNQRTLYAAYKARTANSVTLSAPWSFGHVMIEPPSGMSTVTVASPQPLHSVHTLQVARRARHVLVVMDAMSDFGRAKMNAIRVYPDMGATSDPDHQEDGSSAISFTWYICRAFGLPASKFSTQTVDGIPVSDGGEPLHDVTLTSISSAEDTALNVLRDVLRKTGMHARFTRADGVRVRPDPLHPWGAITGDEEEVDFTFAARHGTFMEVRRGETATISRAIVRYKLSGSNEVGAAAYPLAPAVPAHPFTLPDVLTLPNAETAQYLAEMHYRRLAAPVEMALRLPFLATDWLHPLARVVSEWSWDNHPNDPLRRYFYVITSLDVHKEGEFPEETPVTMLTLRRLKPSP